MWPARCLYQIFQKPSTNGMRGKHHHFRYSSDLKHMQSIRFTAPKIVEFLALQCNLVTLPAFRILNPSYQRQALKQAIAFFSVAQCRLPQVQNATVCGCHLGNIPNMFLSQAAISSQACKCMDSLHALCSSLQLQAVKIDSRIPLVAT